MNLCQEHWDALREAIKARGLFHLVAKSGEEAAANTIVQLEGGQGDFDPLVASSTNIFSNMLERVGLPLMIPEAETGKPPCPICYGLKHCACGGNPCDIANWITYAADGALDYARELGLVPPAPA